VETRRLTQMHMVIQGVSSKEDSDDEQGDWGSAGVCTIEEAALDTAA
jgi:hypothetical protein